MDMALLPAAIFLFYGFGHAMLAEADLLFAVFCCIFAMQIRIGTSTGPFFRTLQAVIQFGRQVFLSPKPQNRSPKACGASGLPAKSERETGLFAARTVKLS